MPPGIKKKKVNSPRKMTCHSGLPFFNCRVKLQGGVIWVGIIIMCISNSCFSHAASYYDNFNLKKHKITSFETLSSTTMS